MQTSMIVITGPTASGKTGLSLDVARRWNGAIISADSRMVYSGLDIGTGKPTWEYRQLTETPWITPEELSPIGPVYEIEGVRHYLIDRCQPGETYTLTDWLTDARHASELIRSNGQLPIVVGGTGLYIKALTEGYEPPPTDSEVRRAIEQLPTGAIVAELETIDPVTAHREQANRRRLVRALEVVRLTGRPFGAQRRHQVETPLLVATNRPRAELVARINQRVDERLAQGMLTEMRDLVDRGYGPWMTSLGLEYRAFAAYLAGDQTPDQLALTVAELKRAIHDYARRQMTYARTQLAPIWIDPTEGAAVFDELVK